MASGKTEVVVQAVTATPSTIIVVYNWLLNTPLEKWSTALAMVFIAAQLGYLLWKWRREAKGVATMSLEIQVKYQGKGEWEDVTSSAQHMIEVLNSGVCLGRKITELKAPNGDVFDFKTKKWTFAKNRERE